MRMRPRARLIYNPTSGREIVIKNLPDILHVYEEAGYETSSFRTTPEPLSAMHEAQRCGEDGFDLIIAAGGDGTVNEVINGLVKLPKRPKVAVLPAGTTNDYARALGVNRNDLVEAARIIDLNRTVLMDIGKINLRDRDTSEVRQTYFANIGAVGSLTELTYDVPSQLKTMFGPLAYFAKGVELLPKLGGVPLHITYDQGEYHGNATIVFVSLTNSVGGFEKIAPDTIMGDGMFTLIVVKTSNMNELIRLSRRLIKNGDHIESDQLIYTKTKQVSIQVDNDEELLINVDGELGGKAPATFDNLKQHLEFVADIDRMVSDINDVSD
ncbi:diacylglycerol kinase [Dolosigranulum pigrum]|uniref:diacylglycerol kinase n=1 Tax=Dolosigranulum pigrum TaxID=29394 RepID=UPI0011BD1338|nr:diacylglycerol kinase [Dolosigranulum pigrum]